MLMNKQEKLPSGDFFVTIARKIIQYEYLYRKEAYEWKAFSM